jgi:hypothetical protein
MIRTLSLVLRNLVFTIVMPGLGGIWAPWRIATDHGVAVARFRAGSLARRVIAGFALRAISLTATWTGSPPQLWVAVTGLNFIGALVIVHAAVFRGWPLPAAEPDQLGG